MYRFRNILVGMTLTERDVPVAAYAGLVARLAEPDRVIFFHSTDSGGIPDEILLEFPDLAKDTSGDESFRQTMEETVGRHFKGPDRTRVDYVVSNGHPLQDLLAWSRENDTDLIIAGRPTLPESSGNMAEKLARKAYCSVLIVPGTAKDRLGSVLVPVDFSIHSTNAVDIGISFAAAAGLGEVHLIHAYSVPKGYYKTGKSFEEFSGIMRQHAEKSCETWLQQIDAKGVRVRPHFDMSDDAVAVVRTAGEALDTGLVVLGARGRSSAAAAILLGSVTESLIRSLKRPILAVKEKGSGVGILDAIFA